jgi:hypothetical protein
MVRKLSPDAGVADPRLGALLRLGAGRLGSVSVPGWLRLLSSMSPVGQRGFTQCTKQGAIARAGRGGGKSFAMAAKFHRPSAAHPGKSSVFVTVSSERSRDIMMPALWRINDLFGAGVSELKGERAAVWPNGYKLLFRGCKDVNECNKRRGTPWVAAGWDEGASIAPKLLAYDIHECVEPRLVDFNGKWFAGGTPGPIPSGYWYELSSGNDPKYPVFEWDARTNQHLPNVLAFFAGALQRMKGIPDRRRWPAHATSVLDLINDPECWKLLPATFVREYLGQWVLDLKALIYRLTPKNSYVEFPIRPDFWSIGVDLGAHSEEDPDLDHAAIAVVASHSSLPFKWVPECQKLSDITVESLAARILQLLETYPDATVYIDSASAGKIIENTFRRMGIPIQAAEKGPKLRRIQLVQSSIANGDLQLHIRKCMDLRNEATALVWNETRTVHSESCDDDAWDALLMAAMPHYGDHTPIEDDIKIGSAEWQAQQEMSEYEQALQQAIEEAGEPVDLWLPRAA